MIYIQLCSRAKLALGEALHLSDVAHLIAPPRAAKLPVPCPEQVGVWKLEAIQVTRLVQAAFPEEEISTIGPDVCYIHRVKARGRDLTRPLRTALAFSILLIGSALGLAWFHSDVDMPKAQLSVYETLTGQPPRDERLITIPYCVGVALGVAVFYALPWKGATTPLEVKLTEYQSAMEETEGKDLE